MRNKGTTASCSEYPSEVVFQGVCVKNNLRGTSCCQCLGVCFLNIVIILPLQILTNSLQRHANNAFHYRGGEFRWRAIFSLVSGRCGCVLAKQISDFPGRENTMGVRNLRTLNNLVLWLKIKMITIVSGFSEFKNFQSR